MVKTIRQVKIPLREGNVRYKNLNNYILLMENEYEVYGEGEPISFQYDIVASVLGQAHHVGEKYYLDKKQASRKFREIRSKLESEEFILEIHQEEPARVVRK